MKVLTMGKIRNDRAGKGFYLASRAGRLHYGVDFESTPGEPIRCSVRGKFIKVGLPYRNNHYRYIEIRNKDLFMRYFYVEPVIKDSYSDGDVVGLAQNIAAKYDGSGMINHVHFEAYYKGNRVGLESLKDCHPSYNRKRDRTYIDPIQLINGVHTPCEIL